MLFYNGDVWATDRALRALHHGFLLVDPLRQSPSHIHRLLKYAYRYGLAIVDPAMDPRLIHRSHSYIPSMLAALNAEANSGIAQWQGLAKLLLLHSEASSCISKSQQLPGDKSKLNNYGHHGGLGTNAHCVAWLHCLKYNNGTRAWLPLNIDDKARGLSIKHGWDWHHSPMEVFMFSHDDSEARYQQHLLQGLGKLQYIKNNAGAQNPATGRLEASSMLTGMLTCSNLCNAAMHT